MRRAAPRPLSTAVGELRDRLAPQTLLAAAQTVWPELVGDAIAREAHPVRERRGELAIACRSAVWANELQLMAPDLIERFDQRLGPGRVRAVICHVSRG